MKGLAAREGENVGLKLSLYRMVRLIRDFEDEVNRLFMTGEMPGTIHLYQGQEAVAAGVCSRLSTDDLTFSTHRPHGHALAKGVSTRSVMAELFGRTTGCCKGKGGSMHMGDIAAGAIPAIAIVGGNIPIATGAALAFRMRGEPHVAVSFFGDGATNEGAFHEGVNMGAIWSLPIVYVCENNLYGASTHINKVTLIKDLAERAAAYGIPGVTVDGNDAFAVREAAGKAIARARDGEGPTFLECKTYRRGGHSRSDPNKYRDPEEQAFWLARDPVLICRQRLLDDGIEESKIVEVEDSVTAEIDEAVEFARNSPHPLPEDCYEDVLA
jgi:acetoin:2,6-dichlorophenolindophenol oxidoreductase subunit alpha